MSRLSLIGLVIFLSGVGLGVVSARLETASDRLPERVADGGDALPSAPGKNAPRIVIVNGDKHNFGAIEQNAKRSHAFVVRNDGEQPLHLTKGETTCKCTSFELGRTTLQPGETTEVVLTWEAKTENPEFSQSAELNSNDPNRRQVLLVVQGKVIQAIRAERAELVFNQVTATEEATARLRVFAYLADDLRIDRHELRDHNTADHFVVAVTPLPPEAVLAEPGAKSGVELAVTLKPGLPMGPLSQAVRLHSNLPGQPPLEIPFSGKVIGDISLAGPSANADTNLISLGSIEPSAGAKANVFFLIKGPHRDQTELKIVDVQPEFLKAELSAPLRDNPKLARIPLAVEIPAGSPAGNFLGVNEAEPIGFIDLETTHPQVPKLRVKVRFLITK